MLNSVLRQLIFVIFGFTFLMNVNADDSFFDDDIVFDESDGELMSGLMIVISLEKKLLLKRSHYPG